MNQYSEFKVLEGKKIEGVYLSEDKTDICIKVAGKYSEFIYHYFAAYGDCCSESWIEHVEICKMYGTVLDVVESGSVESEGTKQEVDRIYKTTIKTDKGDIDIEYRNSSNGYYGGSLEYVGALNRLNVGFKQIYCED